MCCGIATAAAELSLTGLLTNQARAVHCTAVYSHWARVRFLLLTNSQSNFSNFQILWPQPIRSQQPLHVPTSIPTLQSYIKVNVGKGREKSSYFKFDLKSMFRYLKITEFYDEKRYYFELFFPYFFINFLKLSKLSATRISAY